MSLPRAPTGDARDRARFRPQWVIYPILILIGIAAVTPFLWMALTAFKDYGDAISLKIWPWPPFGDSVPQSGNFAEAIRLQGTDDATGLPMATRQLLNTLLVCTANVLGVLTVAVLAAYAFANLNFPLKNVIFIAVLATLMIPDDLTLVPRVVMMYRNYLNWFNTYLALTVPFWMSAFAIFLLRQFFMQIPKDLFDAALIDGAGHVRYLITVVIPLSLPAIVTVALLEFIWTWNEFKWNNLVTQSLNMRNVSVGLQGFMTGEGGTQVQLAMAMALLVVLPVIVLYLFTQRFFTQGITTTGIK